MIVRIRLREGPRVRKTKGKNRGLALAFAALLAPVTLGCYLLASWRLGADMGLFGGFAITVGILSHWQVWTAIAVTLHTVTLILTRYGNDGEFRLPFSGTLASQKKA